MNKVGIFAGSLLVAFAATYIYSPILGSNADDRAGTSFKATLNVEGVVGIRADVSELNLTSSVGAFVSAPVNVDVASNSQYGYTLSIEDADSDTNMVSTEVSDVVSSNFSGSKTSSTMADNNWGYSIDNTDFYAIPASGSPVAVKRTDTIMSTTYETTPVYFGVKVGMNLPATTYADVVKFTAYVNGADETPDPTPSGGTMQGFSCSSLANVGDSTTLTDTRDGNTYTVKKLADGKCWMTQNLRIVNKSITSTDSDLPSGATWTIPASDITGFVEYDTEVELPHEDNNVYINSYGGYYSFYTVTAGWGTYSVEDGDSPQSICPKGWRLPTGGLGRGDFYELYNEYNSSSEMVEDANIVLSGLVYNGSYGLEDDDGYYWSGTNDDAVYARTLVYDAYNDVDPEFSYHKGGGLPVRCVAR